MGLAVEVNCSEGRAAETKHAQEEQDSKRLGWDHLFGATCREFWDKARYSNMQHFLGLTLPTRFVFGGLLINTGCYNSHPDGLAGLSYRTARTHNPNVMEITLNLIQRPYPMLSWVTIALIITRTLRMLVLLHRGGSS